MKKFLWLLETCLFVFISFPLAVLPYRVSLSVGSALGGMLFSLWGGRRRIAISNIEKSIESGSLKTSITPETLARKSFINLSKSFAEVTKIYYGLGKGLVESVETRGIDNFRKAKAKGKGVIIITGHCGNWELMALSFGIRVDKAWVVARAQDNPYLNRFIEKVRAGYGNSVIYKKGALKGILSVLKKNGTVGILMDQAVLKEEGFIVDFLGRRAWTTKMPSLIARKTGTPVLPVFIHRENRRHVVTIHPELELSKEADAEKAIIEDTQKFTDIIGEHIKNHPDEWLWIHRRWKRVDNQEL